MKIMLDAGHGGTDPGGGGNSLWKEKDLALKISLYQLERCKELGIEATVTRSGDIFLTPPQRTMLVRNSKAKYCISNHINAAEPKARGCEIITSIHNDKILATQIFEEMKKIIPGRRVFDRKNSEGNDYYFMHRNTGNVTTFIVEYGFATNTEDTKILSNRALDLAEAVLKALCEHEKHPYLVRQEKPEEDEGMSNPAEDKWKEDHLKYLVDERIVSGYDGWLKKINDPNMPVWAVMTLMANMHKVLKEEITKK